MSLPPPSPEAGLAQSRERLLQALRQAPSMQTSGSSGSNSESAKGLLLQALLEALRTSATLVTQPLKSALTEIAQRHPLALVAGSFVLGGLVSWSKPWRWLPATALMAGLLPAYLNKLVVSHLLPDAWTELLHALLQGLQTRK
jgi:hypothetical protein